MSTSLLNERGVAAGFAHTLSAELVRKAPSCHSESLSLDGIECFENQVRC